MRILRVIARLNIGGLAFHVTSLTKAFNHGENRSLLITGSLGDHEGDMTYLADGLPMTVIPELVRQISPLNDVLALNRMVQVIREFEPDILHTHTAKAGAITRIAGMICRVPVRVHTFHGHVFSGYFSPRISRLYVKIERLLARRTHALVSECGAIKRELVEKYQIAPAEKFHVVPQGFHLEPYFQLAGSRSYQLRESVKIGWVGRFVRVKNPHAFLDFAVRVSNLVKQPCKFIMVGGGELLKDVQDDVDRLGLSNRFVFPGWVRDMPSVYRDMDLVVLTSINEGAPVALIEAMASGLPVCSLNVGGVGDVVEDGITGVLAKDIVELANKTARLIEDPLQWRTLGCNGVTSSSSRYRFPRLVSDLQELYHQLLRRNRP